MPTEHWMQRDAIVVVDCVIAGLIDIQFANAGEAPHTFCLTNCVNWKVPGVVKEESTKLYTGFVAVEQLVTQAFPSKTNPFLHFMHL